MARVRGRAYRWRPVPGRRGPAVPWGGLLQGEGGDDLLRAPEFYCGMRASANSQTPAARKAATRWSVRASKSSVAGDGKALEISGCVRSAGAHGLAMGFE